MPDLEVRWLPSVVAAAVAVLVRARWLVWPRLSPSVSLFAAIFRVGRPLPPAAAAERSEGAGDRVARQVVEPRCSVAASIAASNGGSSRSGEGDAWSAAGPEGAGEEARVPVHQRPRTLRFELWVRPASSVSPFDGDRCRRDAVRLPSRP